MIRIRSKRHNFRRCGMEHPKGPVDYQDDRFTEKELKTLKAEPMLIVETVDDGPDADVLVGAAKAAVEAGNTVKDGRPRVEAIEQILGRDVSAEERDRAWELLTAGEAGKET